MSWLTVHGDKDVSLFSLKPKDVDIEAIAHSLAQVNRFNGHCKHPISVAQHSVFVSRLCSDRWKKQGLLHDASEAYLGDVTKWLKNTDTFVGYRSLENRIQEVIFQRYDVNPWRSADVDVADKLMVRFEADMGALSIGRQSPGYGPLSVEQHNHVLNLGWHFMEWHKARDLFLTEFDRLFTDGASTLGTRRA